MSEPWLAALRGQFQEIEARLGDAPQPAEREARQARHHRPVQAGGRRADRPGPDEGRHPGPGGALQAGERRRVPAHGARSSPARARRSTPTTSAPPPTSRRAGASSPWATTPARSSRWRRRSRCRPATIQAQSLLGWAQMLHEDYDDALGTFSRVLMKEPANALARINVGYICLKKRIFGEAIEHLSKAIRLDNDRKATLYAHYYLGLVYLEREMYEDAQTFFRKTLQAGPEPDRGLLRAGPRALVRRTARRGHADLGRRPQGQQVQSRGPSAARRCSTSPRPGVRSRAVCSPSARLLLAPRRTPAARSRSGR